MGYFLFVDGSGHDRGASPYEVLAGVGIEDCKLWDLMRHVHDLEFKYFGMRLKKAISELKASKILNKRIFKQAGGLPDFSPGERRELARFCLENYKNGPGALTRRNWVALGQAKIAFISQVLTACNLYGVKVFASIMDNSRPVPTSEEFLRKDYVYLLEGFFYFLEDFPEKPMGTIVFDETDRKQSHALTDQMEKYFSKTENGQIRSSQIIPEPLFVHSDLSLGVQIADLVAYIISWGVQVGPMKTPRRPELAELADLVGALWFKTERPVGGSFIFPKWSFVVL